MAKVNHPCIEMLTNTAAVTTRTSPQGSAACHERCRVDSISARALIAHVPNNEDSPSYSDPMTHPESYVFAALCVF